MKPNSRNSKKLLLSLFFLLVGTISVSIFLGITYSQLNKHPSQSQFFLQNILRTLSYSELKNIAHYFAFGPDVSKIHPANTFPISIEDAPQNILHYFHWHRAQMQCIRDEPCYRRNKDKFHIIIWKCPKYSSRSSCSGAGDRFRGILSSLVIAMLAKHVFLVSWPTKPYPFISVVSPGAIDWRVPLHIHSESDGWGVMKESKYPELIWQNCPPNFSCHGNRNSSSGNSISSLRLSHDGAYKELNRVSKLVIATTGTYGDTLCQTARWKTQYGPYNVTTVRNLSFHVRRILFRALFKPSPVTQAIIRYFVGPKAAKEGYLSIHARTGIDLGEKNLRFDKFAKSPSQVMANDIFQCALGHRPRPRYIFISSDSNVLKRDFQKMSSKYNIQVLSSNLPAVHIARYSTARNAPFGSIETWFSFINIFVDFFALANATEVLSNYSQFSGQARIMSRTALFRFFSYAVNKTICNEAKRIEA